MDAISAWFWNDQFWFPEGFSFNDTRSTPTKRYARPKDLYVLPLYGIVLFCVRLLFERYIAEPIAKKLNESEHNAKKLHKHNNGPCTNGIGHNGTNGDVRRRSTNESKKAAKMSKKAKEMHTRLQSEIAKFAETSWKSVFHSFSFTFGMSILYQASWFWDNSDCWRNYPKHELWPSLYYYYMIEGAYYIALLMSLATDVKRKDRNMMIIHHIATINLIVFSYATNQTRIGSLLMVLHRLADMLLQIAKLLLYAKHKTLANTLFIIFVLTFVVTRLYVYPFYVVHTSMIKMTWFFQPYPWYRIGNSIAIALLILHCLWAFIILKMAVKVFIKGPLDRDDRSDTEEESGEEEEENNAEEKGIVNGKEKTS